MRVYISENWRIAGGRVCAAISFAAAVAGRSAAAAVANNRNSIKRNFDALSEKW